MVGISQEKEKEENEDEEEVEEAGVNEEIPATDDVAMDLNHQRGEANKSLQKKLDWTSTSLASEVFEKTGVVQKEAHSSINLAWPGFPEIVDCPTQISQNTEGKSDLAEVALKNCILHVVSNKLRTYLQTKLGLAA